MATEQNKALAFTIGFFAAGIAIVAVSSHLMARPESETQPIPKVQAVMQTDDAQIVWSHQIEAFLSLREEVLKSLIVAPPSDETFLRQAMAMLSTPYVHSVTEGSNVKLSRAGSPYAVYLCADADIITDLKITRKIPSPNKKSTIYLFDRPEGSDANALGYFVVKDQRLTKYSRIFAGCKGSPTFDSIRWTDNKTIEVSSVFMGGVDTERISLE